MTTRTNNAMLAILFRVVAKAGKRQELLEFLMDDSAVSQQKEPGTLRFDVLPDPKNVDAFYVYELYENRRAFEEVHKKNDPFKRWKSAEFQREVVERPEPIYEGAPLAVLVREA